MIRPPPRPPRTDPLFPCTALFRSVIANARRGVRDWLDGMEGCTVIEGHARFEDGNTLRVGDELMSAPQVFLNVGGRAAVPEMPGLDAIDRLTNTSRSEEHTSELQSLMRISYAVFCLKKKQYY